MFRAQSTNTGVTYAYDGDISGGGSLGNGPWNFNAKVIITPSMPNLTVQDVTNITADSVLFNGRVQNQITNDENISSAYYFEIDTSEDFNTDNYILKQVSVDDIGGGGYYSAHLNGLACGTHYYVKSKLILVDTNGDGPIETTIDSSNQTSFTTDDCAPEEEPIPTPQPVPIPVISSSSGGVNLVMRAQWLAQQNNVTSTTTSSLPTNTCSVSQILTQNLKSGSRNGTYNSYTKGIVKEAALLQAHLNRLGFSSGKEDGILGKISDGAIKRMQTSLNTKPDGYVGPNTRAVINASCK